MKNLILHRQNTIFLFMSSMQLARSLQFVLCRAIFKQFSARLSADKNKFHVQAIPSQKNEKICCCGLAIDQHSRYLLPVSTATCMGWYPVPTCSVAGTMGRPELGPGDNCRDNLIPYCLKSPKIFCRLSANYVVENYF